MVLGGQYDDEDSKWGLYLLNTTKEPFSRYEKSFPVKMHPESNACLLGASPRRRWITVTANRFWAVLPTKALTEVDEEE